MTMFFLKVEICLKGVYNMNLNYNMTYGIRANVTLQLLLCSLMLGLVCSDHAQASATSGH